MKANIPFLGDSAELTDPKDVGWTLAMATVGFALFFVARTGGNELANAAIERVSSETNAGGPEVF